jgi:hypothetical protein
VPEVSAVTLEAGAVGRDGVLVTCPAILPELGSIVTYVPPIVLKILAVLVDVAPVVPKILAVLVDLAPVVLEALGHLSRALGTCARDPERHSH